MTDKPSSDNITRAVMAMDLSAPTVEILARKHGRELYSFAQVVGAEVLGCWPDEVTDADIAIIEHALQRREWGGPNE